MQLRMWFLRKTAAMSPGKCLDKSARIDEFQARRLQANNLARKI